MKKVLIGLLLIIPMAIVAAVVLVTNVVLITPDITVASVAIVDPDFYQDVDNVSLYFDRPGMQYQLAALVLPKKATNKKVHWSIENSVSYDPEYEGDIATVDDNGNVTINWTGTFDIVAKTDDGGKTDRCRFEIKSDVARSAYIVYKDVKLGETPGIDITTDEIIRLEACAHPIDVDLEYVTWESSDKNVLSVDANGVVVPQGAGTATVTMKLKSKDFVSGSEKRVAPEIVRTVQITVRGGVFPTALKYVHTDSISLSSIGAEGSTLVKSQNATLESGAIVFSGKTGYAVIEKGGKTMTLRKVESENSIVFENADVIENSTVIVGKVPYKLNAIFAASGEKASGARYDSKNPDVATIDEKTGLITAISSGEVTFTAECGGESISIDLHVRKPVIYFMLEKDAPQGIADECVYGNMYFKYSGEKIDGLTNTRQLKVVAPEDLTGSENLSRFKWSVVSDGDIATIDENGVITITLSESEKGVRKNVKVTAEAKDSPYAGDSIKREYNFTVMYGVNVETADELTKAVNEEIDGKKYEVFLRNDITIRSIRYTEADTSGISGEKGEETRTWCNAPLRLSTSLYGNGHTIDWKHRDYDDPTAKPNIMGSNILVMDGPQGKDAPRVLLRNVKIKSSELPKDNTFASKDFVGIGVETKGNVHVQYCIIENAMYCMRVGSYDNEEEAVKKGDFAETLIEGTIMSNSSKFTCFSWCTYKNQRVVMKNCVYGQAASPSVGFSSGDNNEEHTCNLDIQGILRIYNWKLDVDLNLVGGITNNDLIDNTLKEVIKKGLDGKRFEHLFVKDSGARYMHCGMLFSGLAHKNRVTVTGALEENGFDHEEIKLEELVEGVAFLANYLNPVTFYGYTDESKTPVKHNSNLVHSQELYKLLRGE
ncbi:MAG: Ig-like domain-containing protein [Clostridiales bacterium]|nr:Ig-like domain-containing protein [Clostridiales bacterium]MDY2721081.1 Ig-like domain-containing protein [Eubacteriales bacterium]